MREKVEYVLVLMLLKITKLLPINFTYCLFDKIGILMFKKLKKRQKVAIDNLMMVFPNLTKEEAYELAKKNFQSISRSACECLLLFNKKIEVEELLENPKKYEKDIKEAFSDNKNGMILFTGHFGNWEILSKFAAKLGYSQLGISKKGENKLIEKYITTKFRNDDKIEVVYKDKAMGRIIKRLKSGGIVGLLADLKAGSVTDLVPFFGKDAITVKTIGTLYVKYNPKIIPIFARRLENNKYEIIIKNFPQIKFTEHKKDNILAVTKACNEIYEEIITQSPEQWFWMHRRWVI